MHELAGFWGKETRYWRRGWNCFSIAVRAGMAARAPNRSSFGKSNWIEQEITEMTMSTDSAREASERDLL